MALARNLLILFTLFHSLSALAAYDVDHQVLARIEMDLAREKSLFHGPNCHNTSLIAAGIMTARRFVSPNEMEFLLQQNQGCAQAENPIAVIRLIYRQSRLIHSQVVLDEDRFFEKQGLRTNEKFQIVDKKLTETNFSQGKKICEPGEEDGCAYVAKYHPVCSLATNITTQSQKLAYVEDGYTSWFNDSLTPEFAHQVALIQSLNSDELNAKDLLLYDSLKTQIELILNPPEAPPSLKR